MTSSIQDYWESTLREDIRGFADPHTDILVECQGSRFETLWTQRGNEYTDLFELSENSDFRWLDTSTGRKETYRTFLSHDRMADFAQISKSIVRSFPQEQYYVPGKAQLDNEDCDEQLSHDVLLQQSSQSIADWRGITRLLFLKGDAGSGKTTLLREITRRQASLYSENQASFLYLYVSAQGRSLSNLRDALSGELDDLRAGFTRDAVPALVRNGLVVPIIDGFDELLGAAGYGDAFGSLHEFLDSLSSKGVLIVSARSSFYEIEFIARSSVSENGSSVYEIEPVTLLPWTDSEIELYLAKSRGDVSVINNDKEALKNLPEADRHLLTKPFFASLFPQYVDAVRDGDLHASLIDFLVGSYVHRESDKIVDRDNRPLLEANGHQRIFELVSEFMWEDEKRGFNAGDLRTVAEIVAEEHGLNSDSAQQLVTKITSYAGFRALNQGAERRFAFEHEVYFDHFLSQSLRKFLPLGGDGEETGQNALNLGRFLDSSILSEEVIDSAVDAGNAAEWLTLLDGVQRNTLRNDNRRRNLGACVAGCFRRLSSYGNSTVTSCHFVSLSFGGVRLHDIEFRDCRFNVVSLDSAEFVSCRLSGNSMAEKIVVSRGGKLDIAGLVPGINVACVLEIETGKETYSPSEIRDILSRTGAPGMEARADRVRYSDEAKGILELLQRLNLKYRRTNAVSFNDSSLWGIFRDEYWETLLQLLMVHGIVREERRYTSGPENIFLRSTVSFSDLMKLELERQLPANRLGSFWHKLREI